MGLFSSKKKVYVASSVWNLAGDYKDRPRLMPSVILNANLSPDKSIGLGQHIANFMRGGTAQKTKRFYNWAKNNYDYAMPTGKINIPLDINPENITNALRDELNLDEEEILFIRSAQVDTANVNLFAEYYMNVNRPEVLDIYWSADFDEDTGETIIYIHADNVDEDPEAAVIETIRFPSNPDLLWAAQESNRELLYIAYYTYTPDDDGYVESDLNLYTYRLGQGDGVFEDAIKEQDTVDQFLPAIPLRLSRRSVKNFPKEKKENIETAVKKLVGAKNLEELIEPLDDHEKSNDMNHIFVVPSIPLNTEDRSGKAYLYKFFEMVAGTNAITYTPKEIVDNEWDTDSKLATWMRWKNGNTEPDANKANPQRGTSLSDWYSSKSFFGALFSALSPKLVVTMSDLRQFNFGISWGSVTMSQHIGNAARWDNNQNREKAREGDYGVYPVAGTMQAGGGRFKGIDTQTAFYHQITKYTYSIIIVTNLGHRNLVYGGKSVSISAGEALNDSDESGFLVPIHYPTYRTMTGIQKAELSICSTMLVINSYKVVKVKWYQRGVFKFVFAAVAIVISFVAAPVAMGAASGLLGTNIAVGAALGFVGATAVIVGAIANGIAAIIVASIVQKGVAKLVGGKLGQILGTIAVFFSMQIGMSFAQTGSLNVNWGQIFRADNLLKLTNSIGSAYQQYLALDTADIFEKMKELETRYEEKFEDLEELSREVLGMTNLFFDPTMLIEASQAHMETPNAFMSRTLLTGSDISDLSHAMITGFVENSLALDGPFS